MNRKGLDWYYILYLFFIIFCPPILNKYITIFLICIYTGCILLIKHRRKWKSIVQTKCLQIVIISMLFLFVYWLIILAINGMPVRTDSVKTYFRITYRFVMIFATLFLFVPYVIIYTQKKGYKKDETLKYILYACLLQFLIVFLFIIFPNIRKHILEIMYNNTGIIQYTYEHESTRRWYGFAISLLDGFSCGIGMAAGIAIYFAYKYNGKYALAFIMLVGVAVFNARTGLLIASLAIPFMMSVKGKHMVSTLFVFTGCVILGILVMRNHFNVTLEWVRNGFQELTVFLAGKRDAGGSIGALFSEDFWMIPKSVMQILFGTGHSTIDVAVVSQSDVGYINYLWIFGIMGSALLYAVPVYLYIFGNRCESNILYRKLETFFLLTLLIGNIKFDFFTYGPSMMLFFVIYYLDLLEKKYAKNASP